MTMDADVRLSVFKLNPNDAIPSLGDLSIEQAVGCCGVVGRSSLEPRVREAKGPAEDDVMCVVHA